MTQQKQREPAPVKQYTPETLPEKWKPRDRAETFKVVDKINEALAKGQGHKITAYGCRRWPKCMGMGPGYECVKRGDSDLRGHKLYWYKNRPYTLSPAGWADQYTEEIIDLELLDETEDSK